VSPGDWRSEYNAGCLEEAPCEEASYGDLFYLFIIISLISLHS
jgi:hypothetical protein